MHINAFKFKGLILQHAALCPPAEIHLSDINTTLYMFKASENTARAVEYQTTITVTEGT